MRCCCSRRYASIGGHIYVSAMYTSFRDVAVSQMHITLVLVSGGLQSKQYTAVTL
jgi:hypothetical protein